MYYRSIAALDDSEETVCVGQGLLLRAYWHPEQARAFKGLRVRALRSGGVRGHPGLVLFYRFTDTTLYLLKMQRYDELE